MFQMFQLETRILAHCSDKLAHSSVDDCTVFFNTFHSERIAAYIV